MLPCRFGLRRRWLAAVVLLAAGSSVGAADEIYVSTGEHGEVSFSDEAVPGAERVQVETAASAADPMAELERRIAQTLAVAQSLETSRLAREQARADARARSAEARAVAQPQVIYQERYVSAPYLYPRPYGAGHGRGRPRKPPHGPPDPEPPRSGTVAKPFPVRD